MTTAGTRSCFTTQLLQPARPGKSARWTFLQLPAEVSQKLPRRGRTTVAGTLNGVTFQQTLEPDGQLSHWMRVDESLRKAAVAKAGDAVEVELAAVDTEPEPELPKTLREALDACPAARDTWEATTTLARVDWVHWMTSAKQAATRDKRMASACDMLAAGKKRVCCFDSSGHYDKGLKAPEAAVLD